MWRIPEWVKMRTEWFEKGYWKFPLYFQDGIYEEVAG